MSQIDVQNLTFGYDGWYTNIFDNVNFRIDTDWKLGLVGRNGRGKTTFLNLLAGRYEYTGKIFSAVKFSYFPFEVKNNERLAYDIVSEICPDAEDWEIICELSRLSVDAEVLYRPFKTLSNGERTKLLLAALFLNEGNFLLIDEPTNHLDEEGRKKVAEYLNAKKGFILVSHDRAFLDGCVDHILSINRTDIEVHSGNFSVFTENFQKRQAFENTQNEKLKKEISRLSEAAARTAGWAEKTEASKFGKCDSGLKPDRGYVGHKAAKMMKRATVAAARKNAAAESKKALLKNVETAEKLKIFPLEYHSERLLYLDNVEIVYGGKKVCAPVSFELKKGERIALKGRNGCGKSSILKLISGEDVPHTGSAVLASGLKISYVPQSTENMKGRLADFAREQGVDVGLFMVLLDKTGFEKKHFDGDISSFSEGQKKKVLLAKSLCEKAHVYVWDEPLNYIDVYSRVQIENLLSEYKPAMIFVEHDSAFRTAVATREVGL